MKTSFSLLIIVCLLLLSYRSAFAASARLSLVPSSSSTFSVGDIFQIKIDLDTGGGRTSGTDVRLFYEPDNLEAIKIIPGTIYSQYLGENIDKIAKTIRLSGVASSTSNLFSGKGTFATIEFRALRQGITQVAFDFSFAKKNDSNVADFDAQEDILFYVDNGSYNIQKGASPTPTSGLSQPTLTPKPTNTPTPTATPTTPKPSPIASATPTTQPSLTPSLTTSPTLPPIGGGPEPTNTPTPTLKELPRAGVIKDTLTIIGLGTFLTLIGIGTKLFFVP